VPLEDCLLPGSFASLQCSTNSILWLWGSLIDPPFLPAIGARSATTLSSCQPPAPPTLPLPYSQAQILDLQNRIEAIVADMAGLDSQLEKLQGINEQQAKVGVGARARAPGGHVA
jgi:hypothetical protein